jgi:hypothetical protein
LRFEVGEILFAKPRVFGTAVWTPDLNGVVDSLTGEEIVIATKAESDTGWTWILTPQGKVGVIHRNNLCRRHMTQVVENINE